MFFFSKNRREFVRSNSVAVIDIEKESSAKSSRSGKELLSLSKYIDQRNNVGLWTVQRKELNLPCQLDTGGQMDLSVDNFFF